MSGPLRAVVAGPTSRPWVAAAGGAMLLVLGFDSLPVARSVQVAPWSDVLALALLPAIAAAGLLRADTPVRRAVRAFAWYALAHSVVALGVEAASGGLTAFRLLAWGRQVVALAGGLAVYAVARPVLRALGATRALWLMVIGATPSLAVAALSIAASLSGGEALFAAERRLRLIFVPLGYTWRGRASGLALEPSYLAFFLAVVVVPASLALCLGLRGRRRGLACAALGAASVALGATFSATGFVVVVVMLVGAAWTRWGRTALWGATAVAAGSLALVAWFPGNYLAHRVLELAEGYGQGGVRQMDVSALNTLAGAVGPFLRAGSSYVLLGYGLGGTSTHLEAVLPEGWARGVRRVSWQGMPNLRSLTGRVFAETGAIGLGLFVAIFLVAGRTFRRAARDAPVAPALRWIGPLVLIGVFVGQALKYGSFATPYLWLWLAFAEALGSAGDEAVRPSTPDGGAVRDGFPD